MKMKIQNNDHSQHLNKPKWKKRHKEWKHKNKDGHKHHKHHSHHKSKSSDKLSSNKNENSSSQSKTPVLHARKIENQVSSHKSSTPKFNSRRDIMASNLKFKAEELMMKRTYKEQRKKTEDIIANRQMLRIEESNANDESDDDIQNNMLNSDKKIYKSKRPHKESVAKPLNEDSDDESPNSKKFYSGKVFNEVKINDAMSRLIDDKRSTIKEQIEDEENFTGSSLNVSEHLHLVGMSKLILNKSDSKPESNENNEQGEEKPLKALRKFSDNLHGDGKCESMKIQEKKNRKYTENVDDWSFFKMSKKLTEHETTTQEGTCVVTPFNKKSRKESGFEGYAASTSIISTPILMSKNILTSSIEPFPFSILN